VNGELHALAALSPGKEPPVLFGSRLDGPQNQPRRRGEQENLLPLPGCSVCEPGRNSYRELKYLRRRMVNVTDVSEEYDVSVFVVPKH
jgi:hypothetical protein